MSFFHRHIITGPIHSRRLGVSLGVNVLPLTEKICNYDCVYCECGWDTRYEAGRNELPTVSEISQSLRIALESMRQRGEKPDSVTFSGNGEPTLHPDFDRIVAQTVQAVREVYPESSPKVTVISNATRIGDKRICDALALCDNVLLKLDAGTPAMYARINRLQKGFRLESYAVETDPESYFPQLVENLARYPHPYSLQTLLFRGQHDGQAIDNTSGEEWEAYLAHLRRIMPPAIMIYGIDRETPAKQLVKLSREELDSKAEILRQQGFRNVKAFF